MVKKYCMHLTVKPLPQAIVDYGQFLLLAAPLLY